MTPAFDVQVRPATPTLASRWLPWCILLLTCFAAATMDAQGTMFVWTCWCVTWLTSQYRVDRQRQWSCLGSRISFATAVGVAGLFLGLAATVVRTPVDERTEHIFAGFPFAVTVGLGHPGLDQIGSYLHGPPDRLFGESPCFSASLPCLWNFLCFAAMGFAVAVLLRRSWLPPLQQIAKYVAVGLIVLGMGVVMRDLPNVWW